MKKVEVKSNGVIIGYTHDAGRTIEFLDNDEAKRVKNKMSVGESIYISSRRMGNVDEDGHVIVIGELNELGIIDTDD